MCHTTPLSPRETFLAATPPLNLLTIVIIVIVIIIVIIIIKVD